MRMATLRVGRESSGVNSAGAAGRPPTVNGMVRERASSGRLVQQAGAVALIVRASNTGLRFNPRTPYEVWQVLGSRIAARANSSTWWLADWVVFGEHRYGDRYRDAIDATGLDYQTLRNYAVVARRFKMSRRRDDPSFPHHAEVCALSHDEQDRWLDLASKNGWSKRELRAHVRDEANTDGQAGDRRALRLMVDMPRERRWRAAAARRDARFDDWVVQSLDRAARDGVEADVSAVSPPSPS
jgi:hypothetical protein